MMQRPASPGWMRKPPQPKKPTPFRSVPTRRTRRPITCRSSRPDGQRYRLTDRADIDGAMKAYAILKADPKARPPMPRVMEVIHSDHDTVDELDPTNIPAALRTIEAALRTWDAANPAHPPS